MFCCSIYMYVVHSRLNKLTDWLIALLASELAVGPILPAGKAVASFVA